MLLYDFERQPVGFGAMNKSWMSYEDRLHRVTEYLYDHLDGNLDLNSVAGVAALSPYHWHRIYQAIRGESVTATAKRLRLQRAGADLANTQRPLDDVASRAGYGSVAAFTRAFSDAYGLPPARYREAGSHTDFRPGLISSPHATWEVKVHSLPTLTLLSASHIGRYMDIGRAFESLFVRAGAEGLLPASIRMMAVFLDDPTLVPEDQLRSCAGLVVEESIEPSAPLEIYAVAGGEYAILRHRGPYSDMRAAYQWLFGTWLPQSGRQPADRAVIEEYLNSPQDTAPSELLTNLCLPLV